MLGLRRRKSLQELLDLAAYSTSERAMYDDAAVLAAIRRDPSSARRRYEFRATCSGGGSHPVHPLLLAVGLGASLGVVRAIHDAQASDDDDRRKSHVLQGETDRYGRTALHYAAEFRASADVVMLLLELDPNAGAARDYIGRTPLHCACAYGSAAEVVKILADTRQGAVKERDRRKRTPLHVACSHDASLDVVRMLLERYPQAVREKNGKGATPLEIAEKSNAVTLEVMQSLSVVSRILELQFGEEEDAIELVKESVAINWVGGVALVLDAQPCVVHLLRLDDKVKPQLLHMVGRTCKLQTLMQILVGMPCIFTL